MDDQTRKNPQEKNEFKDLPAENLDQDFAAKVKGGAEPIADLKKPRRAEPITD